MANATASRPSTTRRPVSTAPSDADYGYAFPAIRGIQAGREYYASMCPLRLIPKVFTFDNEELSPELRAQRSLNKGRLPEIVQYITANPTDYCFSAITASIDSEVRFVPSHGGGGHSLIGQLRIPMEAKMIINDGQHRRAAVEAALRENPNLGDESIAVVFFLDYGLERCQQMFADLNRHVVRPSKSIGVLYDHRDDKACLARMMVLQNPFFKALVELERSSLGRRSKQLFTLSAIYAANSELLDQLDVDGRNAALAQATEWWDAVAQRMREWRAVHAGRLSAGEVRDRYIHTHGTTLSALARVGNALLHEAMAKGKPASWKRRLRALESIDWTRENPEWQGRTVIGRQVKKGHENIRLTSNVIKRHVGLSLGPNEVQAEERFLATARP